MKVTKIGAFWVASTDFTTEVFRSKQKARAIEKLARHLDTHAHWYAQKDRASRRAAEEALSSCEVKLRNAERIIAASAFKPDNQWIAERICHYNQACIEFIWANKMLPTVEQYESMKREQP